MIKNIYRVIGVFALALTLYSCEKEPDAKADIDLVPVYSITNINGKANPKMNIYREMPMVIEWNDNKVKELLASEYSDSTIVDSIFKVRVTTWEEITMTEDFKELVDYDLPDYNAEEYISDTYLRKYIILAEDHMDTAVNVGSMDLFTEHIHYNRYVEKALIGEEIDNVIKDLGIVTDSVDTGDEVIGVSYELAICQDTVVTQMNETKTLELEETEVFF
ncbi:hypothetical protein [Saccharicrinis aurantiacus]|uniref:hypothetical protein n=1 Tax=Saccharicrinis aurantiacus TaxID=1849719 RepID=UPI00094FE0F1|nr:hypothetical protein [Saccharicrinis aurantiacus]